MLDVASSTGGDFFVAEHHIFGSTTTQCTHDPSFQLGTRHQHLLLIRGEPSESLRLAARNQCDFLHWVVGLDQSSNKGMANFVISDQALAAAIGQGLTFHTGDDAVDGIINFAKTNGLFAATGREDRSFVQEVGQVCTGETRCAARDALKGEILCKFLVARVHFKNGEATFDVRCVNSHLTVKATWSHQC